MTTKVDVGGGRDPLPGHVNVDPRDLPEVDETGTASDMPFDDEMLSHIHGNSIVPHIDNLNAAMDEFHRVLEPGGTLVLKATHANSTGIFQDPDHNSWSWTARTPEWYDRDSEFSYYSDAEFVLESVEVTGFARPERWWLRPLSWLFGHVIDIVSPEVADELLKLPFAGGRVVARWRKPLDD